jgi:spermatogenic leucine zipper protein 1
MEGFEEKTTEAKESLKDTNTSKNVSELTENIRGLDKTNKVLLTKLLISLDPEKEQHAKKQEMILKKQNSENTVQVSARHLSTRLELKKALTRIQLRRDEAKYRSLIQEENRKLRNNMEQLLQEADHWSRQHIELSELIKSYQESQKDGSETLEDNQAHPQTQSNNELSAKHELEEQVKKLNHDTYSLHLIAALLENECEILQHRVEILKEFQQHQEGTPQEKPTQISHEQDKKNQKPAEAERIETNKQNTMGTFHKKCRLYRNSDACLSKKACNNRFNACIAKRALIGRKRQVSNFS